MIMAKYNVLYNPLAGNGKGEKEACAEKECKIRLKLFFICRNLFCEFYFCVSVCRFKEIKYHRPSIFHFLPWKIIRFKMLRIAKCNINRLFYFYYTRY